jgi:branched-chain amino acid transport system substrate-binding protein
LRKLNATAVFLGPDTLQSEAFGKAAGDAAEGTHFTFLKDGTETVDAKRAKPIAAPFGATLAAYAAVEVFVAAAKANSVNNGRAMAGWLRAGNAVDTIIGSQRFNASGDLQQQPYVWYSWRGGTPTAEANKP